jgi:hypothetical protein
MTQVITRDNMQEFLEKGRVAEFVAPVPEGETKTETKTETKAEEKPVEETKTEAAQQTTTEATEEQKKLEAVEDDLPEKAQKRIDTKHRQMKEAEEWARAQYLEKLAAEKRVGELEAKVAELEKSKSPAPAEVQATAPKQEDFATVAEYVDAQVEWKLKQKEAEQAETAKKTADQQVQADHMKRVKAFSDAHPDYDEVLAKADLTLSMPLIQYIRESEMGPDLAFHLSNHVDVAERLNRLSPIKALAEIGKIEAKLTPPAKAEETKPAANTPTQSRAPAPISTIDGKKEPVKKDPSEMSFKELRAHNEEQRRLKAQKSR